MQLPSQFCWTKYGTEAGEPIASILARKEEERAANGGIFLWGIGSSIRPSLCELLDLTTRPEVVFTPMLSEPAAHDVTPTAVGFWQSARDRQGEPYALPDHSTVTSRSRSEAPPQRHYALVCRSEAPLEATGSERMDDSVLRNLRTGTQVGSSQVTSVVRRIEDQPQTRRRYRVAFRAELVAPYLVVLSDWTRLPATPSTAPTNDQESDPASPSTEY